MFVFTRMQVAREIWLVDNHELIVWYVLLIQFKLHVCLLKILMVQEHFVLNVGPKLAGFKHIRDLRKTCEIRISRVFRNVFLKSRLGLMPANLGAT